MSYRRRSHIDKTIGCFLLLVWGSLIHTSESALKFMLGFTETD